MIISVIHSVYHVILCVILIIYVFFEEVLCEITNIAASMNIDQIICGG